MTQFQLYPNLERTYEYLLVIPPTDEISSDVFHFKGILFDAIKSKTRNRYAKAHVTIINFMNAGYSDEEVVEKVRNALAEQKRFKVQISGVEKFVHGEDKRTIHLAISNPDPFRELHKLLASEFYQKTTKITPHITLAKAISTDEYELIMNKFPYIHYHNEFEGNRLSILKREIHQDGPGNFMHLEDVYLN